MCGVAQIDRIESHFVTLEQLFLLLVDIPFLALAMVMIATLWRAPSLLKSMLPICPGCIQDCANPEQKKRRKREVDDPIKVNFQAIQLRHLVQMFIVNFVCLFVVVLCLLNASRKGQQIKSRTSIT